MRVFPWRPQAPLCAVLVATSLVGAPARAADGPLGIDHSWNYDNSGIWNRRYQKALQPATVALVVGGALWEGDDSRFGHTLWQSVDSIALGAISSESMKRIFSRSRPAQGDGPNRWFQGGGHRSFPSGEVMLATTAITPLVLEYGPENPAVWGLELLPAYVAVGRMKQRAHWQTDVLASFAIGTGLGFYAHSRPSAISVGVLPGGFTIGWKKSF
jgi:hypothetical protein